MRIDINDREGVIFNYGWEVEETIYATDKSAGCAPRKEEVVLENIRKTDAPLKIVCFHWGVNTIVYRCQ